MWKYNFLFIVVLNALLFGCSQPDQKEQSEGSVASNISPSEKLLFDSLQFDVSILNEVRKFTNAAVEARKIIFHNYDLSDSKESAHSFKVIALELPANEARGIVLSLRQNLKQKGYSIYISESNFGHSPDVVSILKSADQFDILRVEQTDGVNHGIEHQDVLNKLIGWNKSKPFIIIGAGIDWVEAIFVSTPAGMDEFAEEVYEFCPDVVDQGTGTVELLSQEMSGNNTLYLWWD